MRACIKKRGNAAWWVFSLVLVTLGGAKKKKFCQTVEKKGLKSSLGIKKKWPLQKYIGAATIFPALGRQNPYPQFFFGCQNFFKKKVLSKKCDFFLFFLGFYLVHRILRCMLVVSHLSQYLFGLCKNFLLLVCFGVWRINKHRATKSA